MYFIIHELKYEQNKAIILGTRPWTSTQLFWKNVPSLPKLLQSKELRRVVANFNKILLEAQGYMYLELLEKAQDISEKEKILNEWEVAQKALLAQNNSKETT